MGDLRRIWNVELDLLKEFDLICKSNGLEYYASCGTLLGAVRHKGFIPWNDDIDLFLKWPDYKRLMEIAPSAFSHPYFFQSIYSDPQSMPNACRLRRSDTTGFTRWEHENTDYSYNRGIFIDVFPLFYVPDNNDQRAAQKQNVLRLWEIIRGHDAWLLKGKGNSSHDNYDQYIPAFLSYWKQNGSFPDITSLKEQYLFACASTSERTSELGATSSKCHQSNLMWNTEWFDQTIYLPFENTVIPCPGEYEKVLEKQYGDWKTPVHGGSKHEMYFIDPELPWTEYISSHFG